MGEWVEPKLLTIYVVDEQGKKSYGSTVSHLSIQMLHHGLSLNVYRRLNEILRVWHVSYWQVRVGGSTLALLLIGGLC